MLYRSKLYKTGRVKSATNTGNYAKFLHKLRLFSASGGLRGFSFPDRPQAAHTNFASFAPPMFYVKDFVKFLNENLLAP